MRTFNLKAVPNNDTKPKSIHCLDNKMVSVCTVWCDKTITVNGQDLDSGELEQIMAIVENFWLFYNNINHKVIGRDPIYDLMGNMKADAE